MTRGDSFSISLIPLIWCLPPGGDNTGRGQDPPMNKVPLPPQYGNPEQSGLTCDVKSGSQTHDLRLD